MPAGRSPRLSLLWSSSRVFSCANSSLTFAFLTEMSQQLMDALSQYLVHVLLGMKCYNLCDGLSGVYPISCNISWDRLQLTFLFCVSVRQILHLIISADKKVSGFIFLPLLSLCIFYKQPILCFLFTMAQTYPVCKNEERSVLNVIWFGKSAQRNSESKTWVYIRGIKHKAWGPDKDSDRWTALENVKDPGMDF